ncbi:MAG TPA: ATP-binding protein [Thermoanaerobaculia bacterium]|nr:ATP-binding protein [Thermoanaerobaculia bacterium]
MEGQEGLGELIDALIADFQERELPRVTPRALALPGLPGKADVVVGMRRSGKTYFLYQQIQERLAGGIDRGRILYLNFEDERLLPLAAADLSRIPEAFYRRFPSSREQLCWFFFDEIQNVPGWETFVRRLIDTEKAALVLTGSSARLLSREIASSLRGRSLSTELLPFSFAESLRHTGVQVPESWPPGAKARSLLEHRLERYLETGGFPEVQSIPKELRIRVLQEYIDVVIFRDVVERHGVDNLPALRYLEKRLLASPAGRFSVSKLFNDLKSQGMRVGKDTLYEYLAHLEDSFLLFTMPVASSSARVRQVNPRKCYPVDPALSSAVSFRASGDLGHLLETVVYLELRRRGRRLAYVTTRSGYEVDFLAEDLGGSRELVQVCADLEGSATRERELRALEEGIEETSCDRATVVTLREEETLQMGGRPIRIIPAWRWLLEPEGA